ncbi:MAG: hypothetical protein ACR2RF_26330 [Geminicoccaceae bacterium]
MVSEGEEDVSGDADDPGEQEVSEADDKSDEEPELDAPAHWALEDQETFRALDPKAQKFLLGRSKDMEAAHTKRSQEIAPLRHAIDRWKPYLDKRGATAEQAFEALIAAEYTLSTGTEAQKREAYIKLGKDYGISLEEPKADGADQDFLSADIQKAVQPLQEDLGKLRQSIAQREQMAQQSQADQSAEQVRQFRDAKTEAGDLAHPYFDEVQAKMTTLAQAEVASGNTPDIQSLYDDAIKLVPSVWAKLQAAQQHAAKKQQRREQKEKVKKAKSAGVSVTGVSSAPQEQPKSLRATIIEAANAS